MNKLDRSADASEPASMRLYFAYGANMNAEVLARRLMRESASFRRRRGVLMNHRLVFNKLSSTDPVVGYANVVACPGECVEGLLNELDDGALAQLDAIELVPHHYIRSGSWCTTACTANSRRRKSTRRIRVGSGRT